MLTAHLSVVIEVQINEGQINEGQRERTGRRSKIQTDLLFASAGSAGLNIFMFIRDFLNKLYKSCVQCSTCCVAVMLPDAHV